LPYGRSPMKNVLHVGFNSVIEWPPGGYLSIADRVPKKLPKRRHPKEVVQVFDPKIHSFNPLAGMDYKKARELAELLYTISPQGENTLTVRNGKRSLLKALLKAKRLDGVKGDEEVSALIDDILVSPILRRVLCSPTNFSFKTNYVTLARIDRNELGEFDALVLGLLLMSHYKGQLIVPDFGFYGRDIHSRLVREERLIAGVNHLGELPEKLRRTALLIEEKIPSGTTVEDAEELAKYVRPALGKNSNKYLDFIERAIS